MPAYNALPYIHEAIESVLNQTVRSLYNIDLLVVCDGDEAAYKDCEQYSNDIGLILLEENVGTYKAINTGLKYVNPRSNLIGTMGADDRVKPTCYEQVIRKVVPGSTLQAYSTYFEEIDERGRMIKQINRHAPTGQFFYTSDVHQKLGGYRSWQCGADTEFWERAKVLGCEFNLITKHLFDYRRHAGQITSHKKYGFGERYREEKVDHIKRIKYDHSLAGHIIPECGVVWDSTGRICYPEKS